MLIEVTNHLIRKNSLTVFVTTGFRTLSMNQILFVNLKFLLTLIALIIICRMKYVNLFVIKQYDILCDYLIMWSFGFLLFQSLFKSIFMGNYIFCNLINSKNSFKIYIMFEKAFFNLKNIILEITCFKNELL